jgi:phosphomannomutase
VLEINGERNPLFPGMLQPEPVAHNLGRLARTVVEKGADVGFAFDGDADRVGIIDEKGEFITPLQTFALLALYLLEVRGERGPIVKSLTATRMVYRLGELFGVPVFETPVGFKYIGPMMMEKDALIGGEESGGFGFRGHIPERDGILSALLFLELMLRTGRRPSELVEYLYSRVGPHHYARRDVPFQPGERSVLEGRLSSGQPIPELGGVRVLGMDRLDGFRFTFEGGSWLVVRFSGTEPLLRLYAEAESPSRVERLLDGAMELLGLA